MNLYDRIEKAAAFIKKRSPSVPQIGVVLGSGLGGFARRIQNPADIDYSEIPHFKKAVVPGHAGRLVLGEVSGKQIAVLQGRYHYYEGHSIQEVVFPVQVLRALGIETLILTNAAGGITPTLIPGDLMIIRDQINLTGANPLRGENDERLGPRFPDMSRIYDEALVELISKCMKELGMKVKTGVYAGVTGPSYETPAEITMLARAGADAAGMSTVAEAIAARHMGTRVAGISCITNMAAGISTTPLSHDEVTRIAEKARDGFEALLVKLVSS